MYELINVSDVQCPHLVNIQGDSFYIVQDENSYQLLSTTCPHQGAKIDLCDDSFVCPVHQWKFDLKGECMNIKNQALFKTKLINKDNKLFVDLKKLNTTIERRFKSEKSSDIDIDFKVHAHACLEIVHEGFSILTDPWLDGPAFYGSWAHHPKPKVKVSQLDPDLIWISHEHSDHFHKNTLIQFSRETRIYFPDFANKRIENELVKLGFTNLTPVSFGKSYDINDKIKITCYEPESVWNDSIVHIDIDGFNILNINDAGVNHKIKKYLPPIDLLCSSFSPGASGYPLCWDMTDDEQYKYYERVKHGTIEMLRQAMKMYQAKFLLPFASHFRLQHPKHEDYDLRVGKNTIIDVKQKLIEHQVIDILPGESWNSMSGNFFRVYGEQTKQKIYDGRRHFFNLDEFSKFYPEPCAVDVGELQKYLLNLNNTPEIVHCENIQVRLNGCFFYVEGGELFIGKKTKPNLEIDVPIEILQQIITNDVSWDEAHIGYWCKMKRTGEYNQNFWRLLQSPYYLKRGKKTDCKIANMNVSHLLKKYPETDAILRRYGLYCSSCSSSFKENVLQAIEYHGLSEQDSKKLFRELNFVLNTNEVLL